MCWGPSLPRRNRTQDSAKGRDVSGSIKKLGLALLGAALLWAQPALSATLYITEYANGLSQVGTTQPQIIPQPALVNQTVSVGGASVQSSAFGTSTRAISVICDVGCSVLVGTDPTATTSTTLLQQGVTYNFGVAPSQKIAVIANTAGNTATGSGGSVTVTSVVPGTGATNLGKAEDAAHTTGDTGVASWGVVTDGVTALAASGDYSVMGTDTAGNLRVVGSVASGATDTGNPVKVGAKYNSTLPTFTDGQRGDLQIGTRGSIHAELWGTDSSFPIASGNSSSDGVATSGVGQVVNSREYVFNGSTMDRVFTCTNTATISVTAAATTEIVALSSSQIIRVCSFVLTESLAGTAKFVYGTGANCGSGTTDITAAMALATSGTMALSAGNGSLFRTAASNALCLTAVTGNITGFLSYAKF